MSEFDVKARLRLEGTEKVKKSLQQTSDGFERLRQKIQSNENATTRLISRIALIGGSFLGARAIGGAMTTLVRGAMQFNGEMQKAQIGLQSVIAGVEKMPFQQAGEVAAAAFEKIKDLSMDSAGSVQDLQEIFTGIVGPMRNAGMGMEDIFKMTRNSAAAGAALGVDFAQLGRDVQLMARGTAGMDTRTFSIMKSMGLITEDTEQWNKMLPEQRAKRLQEVFSGFSEAASAYSRSLPGLVDNFKDFFRFQVRGALFRAPLESLQKWMGKFFDRLIANKKSIAAFFDVMGQRLAGLMERVFANAEKAFNYVAAHWDEIIGKIEKVVQLAMKAAPLVAAAVAGKAAIGVGTQVAGVAMGAKELIGGAVGAGAAGAGAAASGATLGLLAAGMLLLAPVIALIVSDTSILTEMFKTLAPVITEIGAILVDLSKTFWELAGPMLKLAGLGIVIVIMSLLTGALVVLKGLLLIVRVVVDAVTDALRPMIDWLHKVASAAIDIFKGTSGTSVGKRGLGGGIRDEVSREMSRQSATTSADMPGALAAQGGRTNRANGKTVNDLRYSKINVRQEFREADPDRVMFQMIDDIGREAEARTQSGYSNPFTR